MEWFCHPDDAKLWQDFWFDERVKFWKSLALPNNMIMRKHDPMSSPLRERRAWNLECRIPIPVHRARLRQLEGIATHRCDFDLKQHQEHSDQKLEYIDPSRDNERYIPHVIEPAADSRAVFWRSLRKAYTIGENPPIWRLS